MQSAEIAATNTTSLKLVVCLASFSDIPVSFFSEEIADSPTPYAFRPLSSGWSRRKNTATTSTSKNSMIPTNT